MFTLNSIHCSYRTSTVNFSGNILPIRTPVLSCHFFITEILPREHLQDPSESFFLLHLESDPKSFQVLLNGLHAHRCSSLVDVFGFE